MVPVHLTTHSTSNLSTQMTRGVRRPAPGNEEAAPRPKRPRLENMRSAPLAIIEWSEMAECYVRWADQVGLSQADALLALLKSSEEPKKKYAVAALILLVCQGKLSNSQLELFRHMPVFLGDSANIEAKQQAVKALANLSCSEPFAKFIAKKAEVMSMMAGLLTEPNLETRNHALNILRNLHVNDPSCDLVQRTPAFLEKLKACLIQPETQKRALGLCFKLSVAPTLCALVFLLPSTGSSVDTDRIKRTIINLSMLLNDPEMQKYVLPIFINMPIEAHYKSIAEVPGAILSLVTLSIDPDLRIRVYNLQARILEFLGGVFAESALCAAFEGLEAILPKLTEYLIIESPSTAARQSALIVLRRLAVHSTHCARMGEEASMIQAIIGLIMLPNTDPTGLTYEIRTTRLQAMDLIAILTIDPGVCTKIKEENGAFVEYLEKMVQKAFVEQEPLSEWGRSIVASGVDILSRLDPGFFYGKEKESEAFFVSQLDRSLSNREGVTWFTLVVLRSLYYLSQNHSLAPLIKEALRRDGGLIKTRLNNQEPLALYKKEINEYAFHLLWKVCEPEAPPKSQAQQSKYLNDAAS